MRLVTSRILGILAAGLSLLALLLALLSPLFKNLIFRLFNMPEALADQPAFPVNAVVSAAVFFLIAALYLLLLLLLKPSRGGSIALVIVFAAVLFLNGAVVMPLLSTALTTATGVIRGAAALAARSTMESAAGYLVSFFTVPANLLMLLSMGGYAGQAVKK